MASDNPYANLDPSVAAALQEWAARQEGSEIYGGFDKDYKAPVGPSFDLGDQYSSGTFTRLGTVPRSGTAMYQGDDAWSLPLQDPESIPMLKRKLVAAGVLKLKDVGNLGVWDAKAASAYKKVLAFANAYDLNANDALDYKIDNPDLSALEEGPAAPVFQQTNPKDVASDYRQVSQNLTGFEGGGNTAAFQQNYLGQERAAFDQAVSASQAADEGTPGAIIEKPTPGAAAEDYILKNQRTDVFGHAVAGNMLSFFDLLRSS